MHPPRHTFRFHLIRERARVSVVIITSGQSRAGGDDDHHQISITCPLEYDGGRKLKHARAHTHVFIKLYDHICTVQNYRHHHRVVGRRHIIQ